MGVYAADQHLYIHNPAWIWNTNPSTQEGTNWIGVKHCHKDSDNVDMLMDSFGKPISDYPEIVKTISAMHRKSVSINSLTRNRMQQHNTYTCGWWSLYFLLASNNLYSVLPELLYFNIPEIKLFFSFFKHHAIDWNFQNWFTKSQAITGIEQKCKCCK